MNKERRTLRLVIAANKDESESMGSKFIIPCSLFTIQSVAIDRYLCRFRTPYLSRLRVMFVLLNKIVYGINKNKIQDRG